MPKVVPNAESVQNIANESMNKLSSAAKEIGDALGNFGALFGGSASKRRDDIPTMPHQQNQHVNPRAQGNLGGDQLNFEDDEETWREIQAAKEASLLQAKLDQELRQQREAAKR